MEADINCKMEAYLGSQNEEMTSFIKQGNYFSQKIYLCVNCRYVIIRFYLNILAYFYRDTKC